MLEGGVGGDVYQFTRGGAALIRVGLHGNEDVSFGERGKRRTITSKAIKNRVSMFFALFHSSLVPEKSVNFLLSLLVIYAHGA